MFPNFPLLTMKWEEKKLNVKRARNEDELTLQQYFIVFDRRGGQGLPRGEEEEQGEEEEEKFLKDVERWRQNRADER